MLDLRTKFEILKIKFSKKELMVWDFEMRLIELELQLMIARELIMKLLKEFDFMNMICLNHDSEKKNWTDKLKSETQSSERKSTPPISMILTCKTSETKFEEPRQKQTFLQEKQKSKVLSPKRFKDLLKKNDFEILS